MVSASPGRATCWPSPAASGTARRSSTRRRCSSTSSRRSAKTSFPMPASANPFSLAGRTALVTGASGGLGAAIAIAIAEAGADVAVHGNSRSPEETRGAVEHTGRKSVALTADLARPESAAALVEGTLSALGRLDILVNNAGTIHRSPAAEYPDEEWERVIAVNLGAVFRLCRA